MSNSAANKDGPMVIWGTKINLIDFNVSGKKMGSMVSLYWVFKAHEWRPITAH